MSNSAESTWVLLEGLGKDRYEIKRFHNYKEAYYFSKGYARSLEDHDEDSGLELVEILYSYPERNKSDKPIFRFPEEVVTSSQKNVITKIEGYTNIIFEGDTKEEAREFISENLEKSKNAASLQRNYEDDCNATSSDLF